MKFQQPGCVVSFAAVFWMSRIGGALRDIQKTAAKETNWLRFFT